MNILEEANEHVNEGRQNVYGHPADDFTRVSRAAHVLGIDPTKGPLDHALYMILVKMSRLRQTPGHHDSIVDIAGYARTYEMVWDKQHPEREALAQSSIERTNNEHDGA